MTALLEAKALQIEGLKPKLKFKPFTEKYKGADDRIWGYEKGLSDAVAILRKKPMEEHLQKESLRESMEFWWLTFVLYFPRILAAGVLWYIICKYLWL